MLKVFFDHILKFTFELYVIIRDYLMSYPIWTNYIFPDKIGHLFCPHYLVILRLCPLREVIDSHYDEPIPIKCIRSDLPNDQFLIQRKAKVKT